MLQTDFVITGTEARPLIRVPVPGKESQRLIDEDARFLATTTKTSPVVAKQARGSVVLTVDGNIFLDFAAGVGVLNVGHCHPTVVNAIHDQADRLMHFAGTDFYYAQQVDLAEQLTRIVPGAPRQKVFFCNSGTEANEAALKLAKWSTKRPQILAFQRGFHGRTMGSLSLTSSKLVHRERFFPTLPGVHAIPFPNPYRNPFRIDGYADPEGLVEVVLNVLEELLQTGLPPRETAALIAEPIQGEGGYVFPPKPFWPKLKKVLDAHGILLVADEVQTGFGRTGKMFAMEHYGVRPHVTTLAKALGAGLPIGAAVFDAKLDFGISGAHSNTFGGNPVVCAAALANLEVFRKEQLAERAARLGPGLGKRLLEIKRQFPEIGDVRGLGLMWALDFVKDERTKQPNKELRDAVVQEAAKRGLIVLGAGPSALRIIPPLVVSEAQLEGGLDVLEEAIRAAPR